MGKLSSGKSQFQIVIFYDEIYYKEKKNLYPVITETDIDTLLHSSVFIFFFKTRLPTRTDQ